MTYYEWILKRVGRTSGIGYLADEIKKDSWFPLEVDSVEMLLDYLKIRNIPDSGLKVAARSFRAYERESQREKKPSSN